VRWIARELSAPKESLIFPFFPLGDVVNRMTATDSRLLAPRHVSPYRPPEGRVDGHTPPRTSGSTDSSAPSQQDKRPANGKGNREGGGENERWDGDPLGSFYRDIVITIFNENECPFRMQTTFTSISSFQEMQMIAE
jgi:hypothetical protein